jgi:hypothetical protein
MYKILISKCFNVSKPEKQFNLTLKKLKVEASVIKALGRDHMIRHLALCYNMIRHLAIC